MADQPALTVRRAFERPTADIVAALREAPTGWIVDANGRRGSLDWRIRPITRAQRFAGTALTVRSRACDNLAPYAAIRFARPGDVLVVAADAYEEASLAGDVLLGMARNAGIVALVTDGMVRDLEGLDSVGIPVFARGLVANSPHKNGPGEIGLPVSIGGVIVSPGDAVIGGPDGVVVVPRERTAEVVAALAGIRAKEETMDAWVREGRTSPAWMDDALTAVGVRYLD